MPKAVLKFPIAFVIDSYHPILYPKGICIVIPYLMVVNLGYPAFQVLAIEKHLPVGSSGLKWLIFLESKNRNPKSQEI